jgi:mannose/fructose/N-acetylgalactosamine-specific phosphotransferase system component IIC
MENKQTWKSIISREMKKSGFIKALTVFFTCVIIGVIIGLIYDNLQLTLTIGIGLGLLWMGVAYFNQNEDE